MPKLELTSGERRALRAAAHALHPIVLIGDNGLTAAVLQEIDRGLNAHELMKVHAADADRDSREAMLANICESLSCAAVHHLGKMLIIYRPGPAAQRKETAAGSPVAAQHRSGRHIPKKQAAHAHDRVAVPAGVKAHGSAAKPAPTRSRAGARTNPPASPAPGRLRRAAKAAQPAKTMGSRGIVRRTGSALTLRAGARRGRTSRS